MSKKIIHIKDYICERCFFLITNYTNNNVNNIDKKELLNLSCSNKCNFCFGLLDLDIYPNIIKKIKNDLNEYEHNDFKISINFSIIFDLIHLYWRNILKNDKELNIKNCNEFDPNFLRIFIKQLIIPMISQNIHENFNLKSNLEIQIYFEFEQKIYETINEMFIIMGKKNIKIKQNDNSKANKGLYQHIKAIPTSLLNACIEKLNINNLANNNNNNILIINYNILHDSIFLKGNYNKYTREIGQSPWEINGVKVCPSSVEEEMEKIILNYFKSNKLTMSAGGREDKDVRMLGNGRPFILEIFNPKNNIKNIKNLENEINKNSKYIKVNNLDKCDREYTEIIKQAELNKMKLYTSVIWVDKKINNSDLNIINNINNLKIIQKTPLRVLHRRTLTDREKIIHKMECKKINDHFLILDILASAGTYIKEFIHSDLGRTEPNLKSLLKSKCDILQLDVKDLKLMNK